MEELNVLKLAKEWDKSREKGREKEFIEQTINELFAGEIKEFAKYCRDNLPEKYSEYLEYYRYAICNSTITMEEFKELQQKYALNIFKKWEKSIETNQEKEFIEKTIIDHFYGEQGSFIRYCKKRLPEKYYNRLIDHKLCNFP